jgi:tellurite resistance protein
MTVSNEQIIAYIDGELGETEQAQIAQAARHDAALAARIAAEHALRERLRAHFAPVEHEPLPEAWIAMISQATGSMSADIISLEAERVRRARPSVPRKAWIGAAIAASLVIAVIAGQQHRPAIPAQLAQALDTQLASAQDGAPIRILGTFRRQDGNLCRVFAGDAASGIACRDHGGWHIEQDGPGAKTARRAYRQAGSDQAALMERAQAMMAGDPFDAAQERAARDRGWQ